MLVVEVLGFFLFILVFGYLWPAGHFYYRYWVRGRESQEALRIQERQPTKGQIWREVRLSLVTIFIFGLMSAGLFELALAGHTSMYWRIVDYPLYWLPI